MGLSLANSYLCHVILTTAFLVIWCFSSADCRQLERQPVPSIVHNLLAGIENAAGFFSEDYAAINLDGLFGIRLCQGSLLQALQDCSLEAFHCPPDLIMSIKAINSQLSDFGVKALPYIQASAPEYFECFSKLIENPFILHYAPERLGSPSGEIGASNINNFNVTDECFSSILGTFEDNGRYVPVCTISTSCWQFMTQKSTSGYFITHQLLYFILAEQFGCLKELDEHFQEKTGFSVRDKEKTLCENIYLEAITEVVDGQVDMLTQDLFLEQSVFCGILGYEDFSTKEWITMVLSWQTPRGCYGDSPQLSETANAASSRERQQLTGHEVGYNSDEVWTRRKMLLETMMSGDCLAHKTGLAFGALGTYLRYTIHHLYAV